MQLHITIAFAVILHPALYLAERAILGLHSSSQGQGQLPTHYGAHGDRTGYGDRHRGGIDSSHGVGMEVTTPEMLGSASGRHKELASPGGLRGSTRQKSIHSIASLVDIAGHDEEDEDMKTYRQPGVMWKVTLLRLFIIGALVALACGLKDHFLDLQDFIGASAMSICCIILPCLFYLKVFWRTLPVYQKAYFGIVVVVCGLVGAYSTYNAGRKLFLSPSSPKFPFCPEGDYQNVVYTNQTVFPLN